MKVSIIIRARNEERWVSSCLRAVFNQSFKDFEVILVDNGSTDATVRKAKQFDVKVLNIKDYLPGKALNLGIKASSGKFLVSLSAHCIPKDSNWLGNLLKNFEDKDVAGVYGRQEPMTQTGSLDKRDLWITFGLDKRIQVKDSFFHNANSMIRRSVWKDVPFEENTTNIEDRIWAKQAIAKGYKIIYEPEASVYHHHGIHQSADARRCQSIVEIMESIEPISKKEERLIKDLNIVAIIPVKGEIQRLGGKPLIEYTIERASESRFVDRIIISTDSAEMAGISEKLGAEAPFLRPRELSLPEIGIEKVLQYSLSKLESRKIYPDIIVHLGVHAPFKPASLIDTLIEMVFHNGFDSAFPGHPTYKSCWRQDKGGFQRIDEGFVSRKMKKPVHIGYPALACVTYPQFIREGKLLGDRVGIYEILDIFSTIEITDKASYELAEKTFADWWKKQKKSGHNKR